MSERRSVTRDLLLQIVDRSPTLQHIAESSARTAAALERIADAFERGEPAVPCPHPEDMRDVSMRAFGAHAQDFRCDPAKGGCGYQNF